MMDERKQTILRAIVHAHVKTAQPVASEEISASAELGVKSATIRNEMAEMSEMGYLRQPHTSAGRVPSDLGYRFYVDRLMPQGSLEEQPHSKRLHSSVDELIGGTCRLLAAITRLTAIATAPTSESIRLTWLELSRVGPDKVMVVTLWSNGQLRQSVLQLSSVTNMDLEMAGNALSHQVVGLESGQLENHVESISEVESPLARYLVTTLAESLRRTAKSAKDPEVFVDGTSYFASQPEFRQLDEMQSVLSILEEHSTLARVLQGAAVGAQPQVVIGSENPLEPLRACSLVAAAYNTGAGVGGSIGVCGPTRMDYSKVTAAVEYAAKQLSNALVVMLPS